MVSSNSCQKPVYYLNEVACSPMDAITVLPPGVSPSAVVDSQLHEEKQEKLETQNGRGDSFNDWMSDDLEPQG